MRKTLIVVLLCLLARSAHAQDVSFYLYIADKDRIVEYDNGVPIFDDEDINDAFSNYEVYQFSKAFPRSEYAYMHKVYYVRCNSIELAEDLVTLDSTLFPGYEEQAGEVVPLGYTVSDSGLHYDDYLWFVRADEAWVKSRGDSNFVIGVIDTYFDTAHEDMQNKYAQVRRNVMEISGDDHGTLVAGLLAARTDNSLGFPGMGYHSRLDAASLSSVPHRNDSINHVMALVSNRKVLNASWRFETETVYDYSTPFGSFFKQGLYNEIYENGTVMVCAAGNGWMTGTPPWWYYFPASYDHNISVSNVGYEGDIANETFNVKHVHEINIGDTSNNCFQHNSRVDLCAPAVRIGGHSFSFTDPNLHYHHAQGWGTSFASPQVAGTVALMLTRMPWLTPYQVEYILKKSSYDFRHLAPNQKYAGPTRYTGRIGAGTLDAGAALDSIDVDSFIADYPTTSTFRIKGAKLNTRCVPGSHSGVPNPQLEVVMENGTPPYTYKWEAMPDNNVGFPGKFNSTGVNNITITLNASTAPHLFHYRLTVYDNSEIQKVANKVIRIQLTDSSIYDLAMQDSYADMYDEPNQMLARSRNNWDIWTSPDLWNRHNPDGDTAHQDPDTMTTNHMHVRIKNVGCIASPDDPDFVNVHLYWTLAMTGEIWDRDWIGSGSIIGIPSPPAPAPGDEITPPTGIPIPAIDPADEVILSHDWTPPNPHDFDTTGLLNRIDVCALARIQTDNTAPFGMAFGEIDTTKINVLKNNNIVTRNFVSINVRTGPVSNPPVTGIVVGTPGNGNSNVTVQLITENQLLPYIAGHLASYMSITLHLGDLYDVWDAGGKLGTATSYNDENKTVTWDMEQPLRLENIDLQDGDRYFAMLEFNIKSSVILPYEVKDKLVHFRLISPQTVEIDNGDGTSFEVTRDYVHSAVNYAISVTEEDVAGKPGRPTKTGTLIQEKESWFDVYPNPVSGQLTVSISDNAKSAYRLTVTDISGKVIFEDDKALFNNRHYFINTSSFAPGVYHIQLIDKANKTQVKKFVKVD